MSHNDVNSSITQNEISPIDRPGTGRFFIFNPNSGST